MIKQTTVRQGGGSIVLTIPKDMAERHHMVIGEQVFVMETEEGILFTAFDPKFARTMEAYERVASLYKNALRELAK